MIKENDWRITNQENYLTGKTFYLHDYIKEEAGTDHQHCEFCWDKLGQYEGTLHRGYSTLDNYYWVCVKCFDDFKEQFEFKVFSEESFNGRKISQTIREETEAVFKNELIFEVQRIEALMGKLSELKFCPERLLIIPAKVTFAIKKEPAAELFEERAVEADVQNAGDLLCAVNKVKKYDYHLLTDNMTGMYQRLCVKICTDTSGW